MLLFFYRIIFLLFVASLSTKGVTDARRKKVDYQHMLYHYKVIGSNGIYLLLSIICAQHGYYLCAGNQTTWIFSFPKLINSLAKLKSLTTLQMNEIINIKEKTHRTHINWEKNKVIFKSSVYLTYIHALVMVKSH